MPNDAITLSPKFRTRIIRLIADEECEGKDEGKNCTNAEFAKRVGVSLNVITNMTVHGIIPSTRSLIKIADYTNKPFDYILGISDDTDFEKSENPVTFDVRLLELIQENNLRFSDITNSPDITFCRNSIHLWIKRKNLPYYHYVLQLAKFFHVSTDYLLGRTDYKHN